MLNSELAVAVILGRNNLFFDLHLLDGRPRGSGDCARRRHGRHFYHRRGCRSGRSQECRAHAVQQCLAVERLEQMTISANAVGARLIQWVLVGSQNMH
jgi:hypothetical protein